MAFQLERMVVNLVGDTSGFNDAFTRASRVLDSFGAVLRKTGMAITAGIGVPSVLAVKQSIQAFQDFDSAMTQSTAIMRDMTDELRGSMEELAISISQNSIKSARDLAEGYFFLASAGMNAEEAMANLLLVTEFAQAGMFDMAKATDLATDAFSALGMKTGTAAEQAMKLRRVTDTLVEANTLANATVEQFSLALTTRAGAAMKAYNIELEEGVAVLAAMADQGTKAQRAGTEFDRLLRLLTKASIESKEEWQELGFTIFDSSGDLLHMADIIANIEDQMVGLSSEAKVARLDMMGFEARVQQVILPLLGTSDAIREYNQQMIEMRDTTSKVSEEQLKSLASQLIQLKNNFEALKIQIGQALAPIVSVIVAGFNKLIDILIAIPTWIKVTVLIIGVLIGAFGVFLIMLGALLSAIAGVVAAMAGMVLAIAFLPAIVMVGAAVMAPLITIFLTFVAVVAALVAIIYVCIKVYNMMNNLLGNSSELVKQNAADVKKHADMMNAWVSANKDYINGLQQSIDAAKDNKEKLAAYGTAIEKAEKKLSVLKNSLGAMIERQKEMAKAGDESSAEYQNLVAQIEAYKAGISQTEAAVKRWKKEAGELNKTLTEQAEKAREGKKAAQELNADLSKQIATFGMSQNELKLYEAKMRGATDAQLLAARGMMVTLHLMEKGKQAREEQRQAAQQLREETNNLIDSMQREAQVLLMGENNVKLMELAQKGLSQAKLDELKAQMQLNEQMKKAQELMKTGQKLMDKHKSAHEKIIEEAEKLNELQQRGLITGEVAEKELQGFIDKIEKENQINIKTNVLGPEAMEAGSIAALQAQAQARMNATAAAAANANAGPTAGMNAKEVLDYQKQTAQGVNQIVQNGTILLPAGFAGIAGLGP